MKDKRDFGKFFDDMVAFVDYARKENLSSSMIVSTLSHDIAGWTRNEPCFSPRVSGYSDKVVSPDES